MRVTRVEVDDWETYNVGDCITIDGQEYMVVQKHSLSRFLDGIVVGRPAILYLR